VYVCIFKAAAERKPAESEKIITPRRKCTVHADLVERNKSTIDPLTSSRLFHPPSNQ